MATQKDRMNERAFQFSFMVTGFSLVSDRKSMVQEF